MPIKTVSFCLECLVRLAGTTADAAGAPEELRIEAGRAALRVLLQSDLQNPPPDIAYHILEEVLAILDDDDPFRQIKADCNKKAVKVADRIGPQAMEAAQDRLLCAIRLAVCGNLMDFATTSVVSIESQVPALFQQPFSILELEEFRSEVHKAGAVLYLADNAGEIAFDRFLVQELLDRGKGVTVAVKGGPALNDALLDDAVQVGIPSS